MAPPVGLGDLVSFRPFDLDLTTRELRRRGRMLKLAPQPARVLAVLVAHAGQLVTRQELQQALWADRTYVDFEAGLNFCLARLRAVLGDNVHAPRFIETVPRRGYRFIAPIERAAPRFRALAVLPFASLSPDPAEEYLADGVADGLLTELGKIRALRVISRQSVLHLKRSERSLADIARELGADVLVEGTVLHVGGRLRITVQVVDAAPERHLWAGSFEGDLGDFLALLGGAARAVAAAIELVLSPEDEARLTPVAERGRVHASREAQAAYLEGRFHLGKGSRREIERGVALLREAIAHDARHAPAHAALADCLVMLGFWGHARRSLVYPQASEAASRAVALDPTLSLGHVALAWVRMCYDWDFVRAETSLRVALETGPDNASAYVCHAAFLSWICDEHEAAVAEAQDALAIDPVSPFVNTAAAWLLLLSRRYGEAGDQALRTLEMYPDALHAAFVLAWARAELGDVTDAVTLFERACSASPEPMGLGFLGHLYARSGRPDDARALLARLIDEATRGEAPAESIVAIYAGLGDVDRAFDWLERGVATREAGLLTLRSSPAFAPLAADPRFAALAARIGLRHGHAAGLH